MAAFLTIGFYAGLIVGILHAGYIFQHHRQLPGAAANTGLVAYRAAWAVLIWALFGAYLLLFWLLGLLLRPLLDRRANKTGGR